MSERQEPARLREDEALRAVLDSASLDDDPAVLERLGARLGFAPLPAAPPAPAPEPAVPEPPVSAPGGAVGAGPGVSVGAGLSVGAGVSAGAWSLGVLVVAVLAAIAVLATQGVSREAEERGAEAPSSLDRPAPPPSELAPARVEERAAVSASLASETSPEPTPTVAEPASARDRSARPAATPRRAPDRPPPPVEPVSEGVVAAEAPATGDLAAEIRLIQRMRAALDTDPALALRLAEQHRVAFPEGRLDRERQRLEERARSSAPAR